jgi:hypothetical protein
MKTVPNVFRYVSHSQSRLAAGGSLAKEHAQHSVREELTKLLALLASTWTGNSSTLRRVTPTGLENQFDDAIDYLLEWDHRES